MSGLWDAVLEGAGDEVMYRVLAGQGAAPAARHLELANGRHGSASRTWRWLDFALRGPRSRVYETYLIKVHGPGAARRPACPICRRRAPGVELKCGHAQCAECCEAYAEAGYEHFCFGCDPETSDWVGAGGAPDRGTLVKVLWGEMRKDIQWWEAYGL